VSADALRKLASIARELRAERAFGDLVALEPVNVEHVATAFAHDIAEQRRALLRSREDSQKHLELLRARVERADAALCQMEYLFLSVQDGLKKTLDAERRAFVDRALPRAIAELTELIDAAPSPRAAANAVAHAEAIARAAIERFRTESAAVAEVLYRREVTRFVQMASVASATASSGDETLAKRPFEPDTGFHGHARFEFADLRTISGRRPYRRLRGDASMRAYANECVTRLLEVNAARVVDDFADQVLANRRRVQDEMRAHLQTVLASAERALALSEELRGGGQTVVDARLAKLDALEIRVAHVRQVGLRHRTSR
jgi:hypothetical protein